MILEKAVRKVRALPSFIPHEQRVTKWTQTSGLLELPAESFPQPSQENEEEGDDQDRRLKRKIPS